ncbi:MAG: potassium transporter Trk [Microbacteriaceae bacterium]|nr:potassium transporter Trk [Microbacteriaceae bacterium]
MTNETHEQRTARVRRAPKYGVFIGLGAIVGLLVTVAVTTSFPADPAVGMWGTVGYMSLYGVSAGVVLGAVAAIVADAVSRRGSKLVEVERGAVQPAAEPVETVREATAVENAPSESPVDTDEPRA